MKCLLKQNIQIENTPLGHKHFPPWFTLPQEEWYGNRSQYTFENTEDYLFILIIRNPYDWIRSLHKQPWCAAEHLRNLEFSEFIRSPWELNPLDPDIIRESIRNPLVNWDPETRSPFSNIMKLRTAKLKNMFLIYQKVHNFYVIKYETVRDNPQEVSKEISSLFKVDRNLEYHPVEWYKGDNRQGKYNKCEYAPISSEDLIFINHQLNEELKNQLGYEFEWN